MKRIFLLACILVLPFIMQAQSYNLLIGTYTQGKSEGIYVYNFSAQTGEATFKNKASGVSNPSFLAISRDKKQVYAANEEVDGNISSFSFNSKTGTLIFLNKVSAKGEHPCYVSVDPAVKNLFAANYSSGSLSAFPIKKDGSLSESSQFIQHEGTGPDRERQESSHVHCAIFSPDYKYLLAADLGSDHIAVYTYNPLKKQPLTLTSVAPVKAGSGPRHVTFSADGKKLYLVQELTAEVTAFDFDNGNLKAFQTVRMMTPEFTGQNGAADIHLSPDGKFLYATNRGSANEIVVFEVDRQIGKLTFRGRESTGGKTPRNFTITPNGEFVLVANQDSDNVVIFKRDTVTGLLTDSGKRIEVGMPVCLVLAGE